MYTCLAKCLRLYVISEPAHSIGQYLRRIYTRARARSYHIHTLHLLFVAVVRTPRNTITRIVKVGADDMCVDRQVERKWAG